ncbi:MAG: hypothetical protein ACI4JG_10675 [Acutalibacteraceae bacterium]
MNDITKAIRVANTAFKTVRIIDILKRIVIAAAALFCGLLALRFWRR